MTYRRTTRRGTRLGLILALFFCPLAYDAFGNRVSKSVTTTGGTTTTQYLVDDLNPTGYPQVVDELTGPIGSAAVSRTYTYGLQRISHDQYISGWLLSYYQYDGGGSVRQLTNSAGTVTDSYEYDAFGNSFTKQGTTPNNYLYRGEQYDPDLVLFYLRHRYMNPLTGRFVSMDPDDGIVTDPATLHKYLYTEADPVNLVDPNGQEALVGYNQLAVGALVVATGAAIVNYEQHKDQTEGALRQLSAGISCAYNKLTTNFSAWVKIGLAGDGDQGSIVQVGPCAFAAKIPVPKPPDDENWTLKAFAAWYDDQPYPPPPPPDPCVKVRVACEAICAPTIYGKNGAGRFRRCVRDCMEKQGCFSY